MGTKVVLVFDAEELYGAAAEAMKDLFSGAKTEAEVGYNVLKIAPVNMDSWLAAPLRAALEGRGGATVEVQAEQPPAEAAPETPSA